MGTLLMRRRDILELGVTEYAYKEMLAAGVLRPLDQKKGGRTERKRLFLRSEVEKALKPGGVG
jgi:hypothetical protein